ncbi:ATPase P [Bifidobacterium dentium]|uniref:ATPase P n=1 Tax=Bifidobacterium dentium TaxID=1689 RepID=UPI003D17730F
MGHSQILPRPIADRRQIVDATSVGRSQGPPATESSADHVRNHSSPSTDPPSSEAERSANKRPEAAPAAKSAESADDDQRIAPLLVIATILTIPTFVVTMLMLGGVTMPDWPTNPWLHAIVITPVMFYCGAPIHRHGMPALHQRTPNADSLISLGMSIVYVYSLLPCVVSWIFPVGSRDPYFAFVGVVVMLALIIRLIRRKLVIVRFPIEHPEDFEKALKIRATNVSAQSTQPTQPAQSTQPTQSTHGKSAEEVIFRARIGHVIHTRVLQITTAVTMVVAVWTAGVRHAAEACGCGAYRRYCVIGRRPGA